MTTELGPQSPNRGQGCEVTPRLEPGLVIAGFKLIDCIGRGGMGEVWRAEQVSLGARRVALKLMARGPESPLSRDAGREAQAASRVNHPGIVRVYESGVWRGLHWLAMELVEGSWTLRDLLDDVGRLGGWPAGYDQFAARFVATLADAMQAAHEAGVVHRDLTPRNILIAADEHPKVTDFGLARVLDDSRQTDTLLGAGTHGYKSPEQVAGHRGVDHRTDIFSLGVILYEMITLRRPFEGDSAPQVEQRILRDEPVDPRSVRSLVPVDLIAIVGRALSKDPNSRYESMAALELDLEAFLAGGTVSARLPTPSERALRWARRNPGKCFFASAGIFVFLAISGLLWRSSVLARSLEEQREAQLTVNSELREREHELENANAALSARTAAIEAAIQGERKAAEQEREHLETIRRATPYSTRFELAGLRGRADDLWPPEPARIPALRHWIEEANGLVDEGNETSSAESLSKNPERERLLEDLRELLDPSTGILSEDGISRRYGWSVPMRLRLAERLEAALSSTGEHFARWQEARTAIRSHPAYDGLDLDIQPGLVPLGPDPRSGLWEFWHVATGDEPQRESDDSWVVTEGMGLVFVLIPSGSFWMGAQPEDPDAPSYDSEARGEGPVTEIQVPAYFLSKYELTQGQWSRIVGWNPSTHHPESDYGGSLANPLERVAGRTLLLGLARMGLTLPTEAQWERGCRGGTTTPWWTGATKETLLRAVNLADAAAARVGHHMDASKDLPGLDDGFVATAPVGSFAPNPFGLHDVHGNVWEICLGRYEAAYDLGAVRLDPAAGGLEYKSRGGCFDNPAWWARSSFRLGGRPEHTDDTLGTRPVKWIRE